MYFLGVLLTDLFVSSKQADSTLFKKNSRYVSTRCKMISLVFVLFQRISFESLTLFSFHNPKWVLTEVFRPKRDFLKLPFQVLLWPIPHIKELQQAYISGPLQTGKKRLRAVSNPLHPTYRSDHSPISAGKPAEQQAPRIAPLCSVSGRAEELRLLRLRLDIADRKCNLFLHISRGWKQGKRAWFHAGDYGIFHIWACHLFASSLKPLEIQMG